MRLIISTLTALMITVSAYTYAVPKHLDNPNVVLEKIGYKKVQLKLLQIPDGKILVTFKNKDKGIVYKDVINKGKYTKKSYDLKALANGTYSIEVFSPDYGTLQTLVISLETENVIPQFFSKTKVIDKNNLIFLVKTTSEIKKTIKVYHKGHKVFEENFIGDSFGKVFRFNEISSLDDVTFEIRDENGYGKYISSR